MCGGGWRKWDEGRGAASTGIRSCSPTNARGEGLAVGLILPRVKFHQCDRRGLFSGSEGQSIGCKARRSRSRILCVRSGEQVG